MQLYLVYDHVLYGTPAFIQQATAITWPLHPTPEPERALVSVGVMAITCSRYKFTFMAASLPKRLQYTTAVSLLKPPPGSISHEWFFFMSVEAPRRLYVQRLFKFQGGHNGRGKRPYTGTVQ